VAEDVQQAYKMNRDGETLQGQIGNENAKGHANAVGLRDGPTRNKSGAPLLAPPAPGQEQPAAYNTLQA